MSNQTLFHHHEDIAIFNLCVITIALLGLWCRLSPSPDSLTTQHVSYYNILYFYVLHSVIIISALTTRIYIMYRQRFLSTSEMASILGAMLYFSGSVYLSTLCSTFSGCIPLSLLLSHQTKQLEQLEYKYMYELQTQICKHNNCT